MAATDYNQDLGYGLGTGVTAAQLQQAHDRATVEKQQNEVWAGVAFVAVAVLAIVAAHYVAQHRRRIARAVDAALISGLATGVRAARSARSKREALVGRVLAKAAEKPSQPD